ncbi:MAG: hypothetical protein V4773_03705, partial [Verrucomicrobiota bacterium]
MSLLALVPCLQFRIALGGAQRLGKHRVGCVAVSTGTYYVDSTVADDTSATGAAACAFKTVTRAVQFLGT